jgi:hypothetical protein
LGSNSKEGPEEIWNKYKDQCWACKSFILIYCSCLANLAFKKSFNYIVNKIDKIN